MDVQQTFFTSVLTWCVARRKLISLLFYAFFASLGVFVAFSTYLIVNPSSFLSLVVRGGKLAGELSVAAFLVTTYPGILGRFRLRHPLITLGMSFRRLMGISSFLLALTHASVLYIVPGLLTNSLTTDMPVFVLFGVVALFILFPLFLTSNDISVRLLGRWWKRLHRLVYILYWFIFLHVIFQEVGVIGIIVGFSAVLEVASLVFDFVKKKTNAANVQTKQLV